MKKRLASPNALTPRTTIVSVPPLPLLMGLLRSLMQDPRRPADSSCHGGVILNGPLWVAQTNERSLSWARYQLIGSKIWIFPKSGPRMQVIIWSLPQGPAGGEDQTAW